MSTLLVTFPKRRAFTLIELLVVIAIIGILASLIVISLVVSRNRAGDVQRKDNAHSIDVALSQYREDHSATYPLAATDTKISDLQTSGLLSTYVGAGAFSKYLNDDVNNARYSTNPTGDNTQNDRYAQAWQMAFQAENSKGVSPVASPAGNGIYTTASDGSFHIGSLDVASSGILASSQPVFVTYGPQ